MNTDILTLIFNKCSPEIDAQKKDHVYWILLDSHLFSFRNATLHNDIDELHNIRWCMIDKQLLGRNCQIRGNCGKTLKFADVAQIREFCEYRDACEKTDSLDH